MEEDLEIPWSKTELEHVRQLLEQPGIQPITEALRILLKPIVAELIKRKTE